MKIPTANDYLNLFKNGYSQGRASPGLNFMPLYEKYIKSPIVDLGCGAGDAVKALRGKGFKADGIDWITFNPEMLSRDITDDLDLSGYTTVICLDVLEHLTEPGIEAVLTSMRKTERQVMTICTAPAKSSEKFQLHLTIKPVDWWTDKISQHLMIKKHSSVSDKQEIYFCEMPPWGNKKWNKK